MAKDLKRSDSMYQGRKKFAREQIVFVVEAALCAALDMIEGALPDSISWDERRRYEGVTAEVAAALNNYERGVLEGAGMFISIFFAQLTLEGMGAGDALAVAGRFDEAVENLFVEAWKDEGRVVKAKLEKGKSYRRQDLYPNWPDCHRHAELFADELMQAYQ
jgi:hypothetical protein